jgi:hypothetical protein
MGNNPVMMVDPDGELAWFIPIIAGAVIGGVSQGIASSNSGGSFWNGAWKGALIGAASGAAGIGASAWAAGASFTSVASGATALGLGGSLAAGAAAGFTSGAGSTWLGGGSFGQGLGSGFKGAALGAATAGALYGLSKGAGALAMRSSRKAFMESALAFNEYAVDQSTGAISQISTLGGSDTHFYHVGTWSDAGTAFQSGRTFIVDGANTINSFRFWESASSTISAFSVPASGLTGYFLERPGPSTTVANQGLRIPAGSYNLTPNMGRFPEDYMLYNNSVPAGRGITIHIGNNPDATIGCLLPGCSWGNAPGKYAHWGDNWVSGSGTKLNSIRAYIKKTGYRNVRFNIFDVL